MRVVEVVKPVTYREIRASPGFPLNSSRYVVKETRMHRLITWAIITIGFLAQLFGRLLSRSMEYGATPSGADVPPDIAGTLISIVGSLILILGLVLLATSKGRKWTWGLLGFFSIFGIIAVVMLTDSRRNVRSSASSPTVYESADNAIAAAHDLEMQGEWEAAITLFESAAGRWPEHAEYIENRISDVRKKQSLGKAT
jgi:hypothetical protein